MRDHIKLLYFIRDIRFSSDPHGLSAYIDWLCSFKGDEDAEGLGILLKTISKERYIRSFEEMFYGTDINVRIPHFESVYTGERNVLNNEVTAAVSEEYHTEHLKINAAGELPDDVGFETEYLLYLLEVKGDTEKAKHFLSVHYLPFLTAWALRISESNADELYKHFSRFILKRTARKKSFTDGLCSQKSPGMYLYHKTGQEKDKQTEAGRYHFEYISDEEIASSRTLTEERTSGSGNCGGRCRIRAFVRDNCLIHLESDIETVGQSIKACARGRGYRKTFFSPDRLRYPMMRIGERGEGKFKRISWDQALDIIFSKLSELTDKYGPGCRYVNYSSGVSSVLRGDMVAKRLLAETGGYLACHNSYSAACTENAVPVTYGTRECGSAIPTFKDSKLIILWGYNPVVTLFNSMMFDLLKYHKEKGTPVIVIDPQFSDTAAMCNARWIPIKPSTDAALAAAIAYVLWEEDLCDTYFMDTYCLGFDPDHMPKDCKGDESYRDYIYGIKDGVVKTPLWAEKITGIPADEIISLARIYGNTHPCAILSGLGPQRHGNGEQTVRAVQMLQCMTGNVGIKGGSTGAHSFPYTHLQPVFPAIDNPYNASIPSFLWTRAVCQGHLMTKKRDRIIGRDGLDSDIKVIFNLAGNTLINQHSDINRTSKILKDTSKCELIIVSDLFMTSSARYADILLPGVSLFEREGITSPWREGDYLLYGKKVIEPLFECRNEPDWLYELAKMMNISDLFEGCEDILSWNRLIYNRVAELEPELPSFEDFRDNGGYKYRHNEYRIAFEDEINDPENHPFPTESGKIEIFSRNMKQYDDEEIPCIPKYIPAYEGPDDPKRDVYPVQLIGWHTKRRCHSVHDNNELMEQIEPHRCWINPVDAEKRLINDEDMIEIFNDRGHIRMKARISERIMKGTACIPQGAWYEPDEEGTDIRGNINTLTHLVPTPYAKGNPQHSNLVEIRKAIRKIQ